MCLSNNELERRRMSLGSKTFDETPGTTTPTEVPSEPSTDSQPITEPATELVTV